MKKHLCKNFLRSSALAALALAPLISLADLVQGVVSPDGAVVRILDASGTVVATLKGGPFQVTLAAGKFTAECVSPTAKKRNIYSLAQPTTINIDCR